MKSLLLGVLLFFSVGAIAEELRTYDCKAPSKGDVTVDEITVQANKQNLVLSFPGYAVTEKVNAVFERVERKSVPEAIKQRSVGTYLGTKNSKSLVAKKRDTYKYAPMYAFATNGLLRHDDSGSLIMLYKRTINSGNDHEWTREYRCEARDLGEENAE